MTVLSILIPTKNRSEYLGSLLPSILKWKRNDFEIVIQDNSDNRKTEDVVTPYLDDPRVKYFSEKHDLSVVDNFECAVKNSIGKIITAIGDDDGILPAVMDISDWMIENQVDAVLTDKADYVWPDLVSRYNSSYNNSKLNFSSEIDFSYQKLDPLRELELVCNRGGTSMGMLPRIYYGLVSKKSLDIVFNTTGQYFPGPSPDMANAISLGLSVKTFFYLKYPAFIAGSSSKSTAGLGLKRQHVGEISSIKHLPKNTLLEWDCSIPKFWSGPTIWAQSASIVLKKMGWEGKINYNYLYARCFVFFPSGIRYILCAMKEQRIGIKMFLSVMFWYVFNWGLRFNSLIPKVLNKIGLRFSKKIIIDKQLSISQAIDSLNSILKCGNK